jgi:predicted acylesterase/phospholipase RssA
MGEIKIMAYLLSLAIALLAGKAFGLSDKCYTLSMEGGGSHGAYEAGVLWSWATLLPAEERVWDIITGISAGALNSRVCAQFKYGDEINMAEKTIEAWLSAKTMDTIAVQWSQGMYYSILFKPSLYNSEPMLQFLKDFSGNVTNRNVTVGVTDYESGEFMEYTQEIGVDLFSVAAKGSASIPLVFTPTELDGHWYGDGGVLVNLNTNEAISFCRDLGYSDSDIVVDMIRDFDGQDRPAPMIVNNTKEAMDRASTISDFYSKLWFLFDFAHSFPHVDVRFIAIPSKPLPPWDGQLPLDFNPEHMQWEVELGKKDGQTLVTNGVKGRDTFKSKKLDKAPETHYF